MSNISCLSKRCTLIVTSWFAFSICTSPVAAIDIVLEFNSAQSDFPSFDPTGARFQALFEHAEALYEDVFQDTTTNTTLTLNYWYENLSGSTIGFHTLQNQTTVGGTLPNRQIEGTIRIDTRNTEGVEHTWFIDPTPTDDSEFNMQQELWRDASSYSMSDLFNDESEGNIPGTFETAFSGPAVTGGAADGVRDMLTLILHEMGHALGMSSANAGTIAETPDNDYDFNPDFIRGQTLAVETADGGNVAHLDTSGNFLMDPGIPIGRRRRPSHPDLFAMAAGHNYTSLDLPRREFYQPGVGGNWNDSASWSGNEVPEIDDDVFIRDNRVGRSGDLPTVELTTNSVAANVTIAEGASMDVDAQKLTVVGTIQVTDPNSRFFIRSGGRLEADTLKLENDANLLSETDGRADVNRLIIDGGRLTGAGTVNVKTEILNNGNITADHGTLTITTSNREGMLNLDGADRAESGQVNATDGNLVVDGPLTDAFNGTMNVSSAHRITFNNDWKLSAGSAELAVPRGTMNLTDGVIDGMGKMITQGTLRVSAGMENGVSVILSPIDFGPDADVAVNTGAKLEVGGPSNIFPGAAFNGDGQVVVKPTATLHLLDGAAVDIEVRNEGGLSVGYSLGTATVDAFSQTASGIWSVELTGESPSTKHDQLNVTADAKLDGVMAIQADNSYTDPDLRGTHDDFTVMTAESVTGTFRNIEYDGNPLTPTFLKSDGSTYSHQGNGLFRNVQYDSTSVVFTNLNALEGDADGDIDVDITDFHILTTNFDSLGVNSETNEWTTADFDVDGDVDITDFNFVVRNYSPNGYGNFLGNQVPEPNTLLLVVMGGLLSRFFWTRRRI